jgi:hypothetical protein
MIKKHILKRTEEALEKISKLAMLEHPIMTRFYSNVNSESR